MGNSETLQEPQPERAPRRDRLTGVVRVRIALILGVPGLLFIAWGLYLVTMPLHRGAYRDSTDMQYLVFGLVVLAVGGGFAGFAVWIFRAARPGKRTRNDTRR